MSQNSQQGALNWLAGQVRVLLKKMDILENGQSKVPIALDALVASSAATVQGGGRRSVGMSHQSSRSTSPQRQLQATPRQRLFRSPHQLLLDRISQDFTVYAAPDPVVEPAPMEYVSPALAMYVAPVSVEEYIAPAPTPVPVEDQISPASAVYAARVLVVEYIAPAPTLVPVVEHISSAPAGYAAPVPLVKYVAAAVLVPVVENISPDPTVYAAPAPLVEFIAPAPVASFATPDAAKAPMVQSSPLLRQWRATSRRLQLLPHQLLSLNTLLQIQRCMWHQLLWWNTFLQILQSLLLLSTSRLRRWSLPKQLFTRWMRRYAVTILRSYPTWHV